MRYSDTRGWDVCRTHQNLLPICRCRSLRQALAWPLARPAQSTGGCRMSVRNAHVERLRQSVRNVRRLTRNIGKLTQAFTLALQRFGQIAVGWGMAGYKHTSSLGNMYPVVRVSGCLRPRQASYCLGCMHDTNVHFPPPSQKYWSAVMMSNSNHRSVLSVSGHGRHLRIRMTLTIPRAESVSELPNDAATYGNQQHVQDE